MANTFIWHELLSNDVTAALDFYCKVTGWTAAPFGGDGHYIQLSAGDLTVGGMMALPPEAAAAGAPPRWSGYIGVADVDAETESVKRDGGAIYMPPTDIPEVGRFSVVADPQGAVFNMMTPLSREPRPPVPMGAPGHFVWNELHAKDWEAGFAFYAPRFGWEKGDAMDMGPMGTYQIFTIDGVMAGGMMNSPMPHPTWLHYIAVEDIDAAKDRVEANGGAIIHGPAPIPGGFIVQATDPQGVLFALVGPRAA